MKSFKSHIDRANLWMTNPLEVRHEREISKHKFGTIFCLISLMQLTTISIKRLKLHILKIGNVMLVEEENGS